MYYIILHNLSTKFSKIIKEKSKMADFLRFWSKLDGFDRSSTTQRRTKEKNSRFNAKLLTLMPTASLRHSTFKYIGSRNRTIRRNRAYEWKSNSAMLDFWFIVDRFYFCHIENSRNPTLSFNLFPVSYFLYDWMLPVQQRNLFQCDWSIFLSRSITFHKDFKLN